MSSGRDLGSVEGVNRRSFLQSSGAVATGVAVTIVPGAATGDMPREPVMAYVHNAQRGEVTVLSGTEERTYRDPVLAKRLLDAANPDKA